MSDRSFWPRLRRAAGYWLPTWAVRFPTRLLIRFRVEGLQHIPLADPCLLICNHISHFDPPLLATLLPRRFAWVVALDMFAHPLARAFFRGIDAISVNRDAADSSAVKGILRRLRAGEPVGLFPEAGIRSGSSSVLGGASLDPAVGGVAAVAKVPIVPCIMLGTDRLYRRDAWWPRRTTVHVRFGEPLTLDPHAENPRADLTSRAERAWRSLAAALRADHRLSDDDFPKTAQERWAE